MNTILPPEFTGVMFISGYSGSGKSFLASQADLPDNIIYLDFEDKGKGIDTQLRFGSYKALVQDADGDPQTLHNLFINTIEGIPQDRYTVMVLDNSAPLEIAMRVEGGRDADFYAKRYGLNAKNIKTGAFGGAKAVVNPMIDELCSRIYARGVNLIVVITHISAKWGVGGKIPNKYNPKGAARWGNLSICTLLLIPGDKPPVPDAIVWKEQLGTISISDNLSPEQLSSMMRGESGHTVSRRLPARIPQCTMQKIRWYLTHPVDWDNPNDDEKMREEEMAPFDDKLSKEQLGYILMAAKIEEQKKREEEELLNMLEQNDQLEKANGLVKHLEDYDGILAPVPVKKFLASKGAEVELPVAVKVIRQWKEQN